MVASLNTDSKARMAKHHSFRTRRFILSSLLLLGLSVCAVAGAGSTAGQGAGSDPSLKTALKYFDEKKYDSALVVLRKISVQDPSNGKVRYEIALAHALLKQQDSAILILEDLKSHSDASDKYFQLLSNCYSERDDTAKARQVLVEGSLRFPNSGKLHLELGLLELQQRHLEEALDQFEEGIQVEPGYSANYYWAARSYANGNEKIWTVLYGELLMNVDPNPTHASLISGILYAAHNSVYEDFKKSKRMVYSKAKKGAADASQVSQVSFEDVFIDLMTKGAEPLNFFKDFEIPVASIDTMQTLFTKAWYEKGYDKQFPNPVIERHKLLLDKGLHTAYTFHLMQFAKPIEFKTYIDAHKKDFIALMKWMQQNPLVMSEKNRFSRFYYN